MIYLSRYWQSILINQRILLVKPFIKHVEDLEYDLNVSNSSRTTFWCNESCKYTSENILCIQKHYSERYFVKIQKVGFYIVFNVLMTTSPNKSIFLVMVVYLRAMIHLNRKAIFASRKAFNYKRFESIIFFRVLK